jgi:hypothetical protein
MVVVAKKTVNKKPSAKAAVSGMGPENGSAAAVNKLNSPAAPQKSDKPVQAKAEAKTKEKPAKEKVTKEKAKKPKLVRDSFAMPEAEYDVLRDMKKECMKAGVDIKKSELLRVGVALLKKQTPADIQAALAGLVPLKAGRPKKTA